jgi:hypothetical protein
MKAPGRRPAALIGAALLTAAVHAQAPGARLEGTWEYRQANAARADGLDAEGERLVVTRQGDGRLTAHYFGLERTGEHGLYYTAVDLGPLLVGPDGRLAFSVPARTLYRSRPASVADAAGLPSAGRTTDVLAFSGRVAGDTLLLTCTSAPGACPDDRLVLRRLTGRR